METNKESFEYRYSAPEQMEIKKIREKYLPKDQSMTKMDQLKKLDRDAEKPGTVLSILLGVVGTLVMGFGMSCTMVITEYFVPGVIVGVIGIAMLSFAYPVYKIVTRKQREKIAPQVLALAEELEKLSVEVRREM